MNESDLRKKIGLEENELLNTSKGLVDIFDVSGGKVQYGFVATGGINTETVENFLNHFKT